MGFTVIALKKLILLDNGSNGLWSATMVGHGFCICVLGYEVAT